MGLIFLAHSSLRDHVGHLHVAHTIKLQKPPAELVGQLFHGFPLVVLDNDLQEDVATYHPLNDTIGK